MTANHSARSGGTIEIFFRVFLNMKVFRVFLFEPPHRGDSNEYTHYTIININRKITLNYPKYNNVCSIFPGNLKTNILVDLVS